MVVSGIRLLLTAQKYIFIVVTHFNRLSEIVLIRKTTVYVLHAETLRAKNSSTIMIMYATFMYKRKKKNISATYHLRS